jgi:hypothetical protein
LLRLPRRIDATHLGDGHLADHFAQRSHTHDLVGGSEGKADDEGEHQ